MENTLFLWNPLPLNTSLSANAIQLKLVVYLILKATELLCHQVCKKKRRIKKARKKSCFVTFEPFFLGSPYRMPISSAILKLQESGRLHVLKRRWWKEKRGGGQCPVSYMFREFGLVTVGTYFKKDQNMIAIFFIWSGI